jgi:hypothetical protein
MAAMRRADKGQWALGDALVEAVPARGSWERQDAAFAEIAERAKAEGFTTYGASYLRKLRDVAKAFPERKRPGSITLATEARTPAVLRQAEKIAAEGGVKVTKRQVREVRTAVHAEARRATGLPARPQPRQQPEHKAAVERAASRPASETRRMADVLALGTKADQASRLGRQFVESLAGRELTDDEKEELIEDIDLVLATWKAARQAVRSPLSKEAEEFLKGVGA